MRQYIVGLLTVILVLGGMTWWAFSPWLKEDINNNVERFGWEPFKEPETFSWSMTLKPEEYMADTAVEESYNMSCVLHIMNADQFPGFASASLKMLQVEVSNFRFELIDYSTIGGWPEGTVPEGKEVGYDGFVYRAYVVDDATALWPDNYTTSGDNPQWFWVGEGTGWQTEIFLSVVASHSHIDRTRHSDVHMGSDSGPTHSNESRFEDQWEESDEQTVACTFGNFGFSGTVETDPPNEVTCPAPDTSLRFWAGLHKSSPGDIQYGAFEDIQCSNIELQLDGISEEWSHADYWTIGNGSALEIWSHTVDPAANAGWGNNFRPPYITDLTEIGLVDFEETVHNPKYDDILVWIYDGYAVCPEWQAGGDCNPPAGYYPLAPYEWGGASPTFTVGINPLDMICPYCGSQLRPNSTRRVPYINADYPDTSETDWISEGDFAEGTACPITIGDMHTVFNPYVQRVSPFSGWDMDADYATEFWAPVSGNIVILLDRTSARTGVTA